MGVRGLTTLVDDNKDQFLKDFKLHDTKVIIDGSNLYYFLYYHYNVAHQFGGDYDHYGRKCKRFFNILNRCNITPYVVFDGGYNPDDRKLPTVLERMKARRQHVGMICARGRGCVLPILAYETFRQVLLELNVPHASCEYEADREIAVLANKWNCPVLSNDSDFFVFHLRGGFIPLDYINLTLCVYNAETKVEMVLGKGQSAEKSEFMYIPVKQYHFGRFVKHFKKHDEEFILPLFATLTGNDYVDMTALSNFYDMLHGQGSSGKQSFGFKAPTRMLEVLCWLDTRVNTEMALNGVIASIPKDERDSIGNEITQSFQQYRCLNEFSNFDLQVFFESKHDTNITNVAESTDNVDMVRINGVMNDFYGNVVPGWFVKGLRGCKLAGSFLQNVVVSHRVILNCQVELLKEMSTYACSRNIRSVVYGILLGNESLVESIDNNRKSTVEEYDRDGKNTKKFYVKPVIQIMDTRLPDMASVIELSSADRLKILLSGLEVPHCLQQQGKGGVSLFLIGVFSHWVKNAEPLFTENHFVSLLVCSIVLHLNALQWVKQKIEMGDNPVKPHLCEDIVEACELTMEKTISSFIGHMAKHFVKPDHSRTNPNDIKIIHGFAQYQACLLDAMYLAQVLDYPVVLPSPGTLFNGTFVYNLCRDLDKRKHPYLYLRDIMGPQIYNLLTFFKDTVAELCKEIKFEVKANVNKALSSKKKSKVKQTKSEQHNSIHAEPSEQDECGRDLERTASVFVNCDVNNKFALLDFEG